MQSYPIVLFAYARPDHLRRALISLKENGVPFIYAFSDGPRTPDKSPAVTEVREILRSIDWCEVELCEREANLGLGFSMISGISEVLELHEAAIIFEEDVICVPGTYTYLCSALEYYSNDNQVMTVTGWTHPLVLPNDIANQPYFDGRGEGSWNFGTWRRAWQGMEQNANALIQQCKITGIDIYRYGADLPEMAKIELKRNIWAVRFCYWHILNRGLCLRPPWSMVEHIGFDAQGTNAKNAGPWANPPLKPCPPIPTQWPEPVEHAECAHLWQQATGKRPTVPQRFYRFARHVAGDFLRCIISLVKKIDLKSYMGKIYQ